MTMQARHSLESMLLGRLAGKHGQKLLLGSCWNTDAEVGKRPSTREVLKAMETPTLMLYLLLKVKFRPPHSLGAPFSFFGPFLEKQLASYWSSRLFWDFWVSRIESHPESPEFRLTKPWVLLCNTGWSPKLFIKAGYQHVVFYRNL